MADEKKNTALFSALDEKITSLQKERAEFKDAARRLQEEKDSLVKEILKKWRIFFCFIGGMLLKIWFCGRRLYQKQLE